MRTAKAKLKSVNASPLKRRRVKSMMTSNNSGFPNAAVVAMGFKNSGNVRRIVSQGWFVQQ